MSKSKKNIIDPQKIIENYGADAVRLFILYDSPPEKDVQWSEEGIKSSYRFIKKLWSLHEKILEKINDNLKDSKSDSLNKFTNKFIDKVSRNLNTFSYNIIIANLHEMYTFLIKEINKDYSKSDLIKNYEKILIVVMPVIPHFSNECLKVISPSKIVNWPTVEERYLVDKEVNIVVQIN